MANLSVVTSSQQEKVEPLHSPSFPGMVWIPGGTFVMGSDHHYPEEAPTHRVTVEPFWMDTELVTNAQFRTFVNETGYCTQAEIAPDASQYPGAKTELLVPGSVVFRKPRPPVDLSNHYNWWGWVSGANWRHPYGPGTRIRGRERHPVVHLSYQDVEAYAEWADKELPTEAEWEFAARGGLAEMEYAWGDTFMPGGKIMANVWQGEFPFQNLCADGYEGTSPVGAFPPNGYGLYDMIGNVWEWTTDWYQSYQDLPKSCCGAISQNSGIREKSYDPRMPEIQIPRKVMKGGSHLCAPNYCQRYRPAARMGHPIDTGTCHLGFRCIVRQSPSGNRDDS